MAKRSSGGKKRQARHQKYRGKGGSKGEKPEWPYPDVTPMTAHPSGYWVKYIRGKLYYAGRLDHPQEALDWWYTKGLALKQGRNPPMSETLGDRGPEVRDVVNWWLQNCQSNVESGELSAQTFQSYRVATEKIVRLLRPTTPVSSLRPDDFAYLRAELGKTLGPHALGRHVTIARMIFSWAYNQDLIEKPPKFGAAFRKPGTVAHRRARRGKRTLWERDEVLWMLWVSPQPLESMILLAINAGFGPADCAALQRSHINLQRKTIQYRRPKTEVDRKVTLWPETAQALGEWLEARPSPRDPEHDNLVFLTAYGRPWVRSAPSYKHGRMDKVHPIDQVTFRFRKIRDAVGPPENVTIYGLRHTFRTVADEAGDQHAVHRIMGHALPSMSDTYVERIDDQRLQKVTEHVRRWLFGLAEDTK